MVAVCLHRLPLDVTEKQQLSRGTEENSTPLTLVGGTGGGGETYNDATKIVIVAAVAMYIQLVDAVAN